MAEVLLPPVGFRGECSGLPLEHAATAEGTIMLAIPFFAHPARAAFWLVVPVLLAFWATGELFSPKNADAQVPAKVKVLVNQWDAAPIRELLTPWAAANSCALTIIETDTVDAPAAMQGHLADIIVPFQAVALSQSGSLGFDRVTAGMDKLVLVVHQACVLEEVSGDLLEAITSGQFHSWQEVGGPAVGVLVCRPLQDYDGLTGERRLTFSTPGKLRYTVAKNLTVIGWLSQASVDPTVKELKPGPGAQNYPRLRELTLLVPKAQADLVGSLRTYLASETGREHVYHAGFAPMP